MHRAAIIPVIRRQQHNHRRNDREIANLIMNPNNIQHRIHRSSSGFQTLVFTSIEQQDFTMTLNQCTFTIQQHRNICIGIQLNQLTLQLKTRQPRQVHHHRRQQQRQQQQPQLQQQQLQLQQ